MNSPGPWLLPAIDAAIALAFLAIVAALLRFMQLRRGAPLNRLYGLLAGVISLAGIAHGASFLAALTGSGGPPAAVRVLEALAVVVAAAILFRLLPRSVDPPGRAALMRSKTALERAEALAHLGSWHWNPATNRAEWSAELHQIYGLEPGTFEGSFEAYFRRVHPDDRRDVEATVRDALERGTSFSMRERIVRPDGEVRVLSSIGDAMVDAQGQVIGMFGACHDVTEQARGEEQRQQMERTRHTLEQQFFQSQKLEALGRLAGGIAHDFNNMLLVVLGSVSLLLQRKTKEDAEWNDLRAIEDAAERAGGLTGQLLAVARRQVLTTSDVDLNSVIREMEEMLRRSLGDDIRVVLSLAPDKLIVRADPSQLHQVLLNLAVNARDAMPNGGTLTISTRAERDRSGDAFAVAEVTDTGAGMDADVLGHLFEPFFTTKGSHGTGLGLATVYGIVSQSGGRLDVRSTPGEGTTFSVHLPRLAQELEQKPDAGLEAAPAGGTETVLVVDDSEPVLALTSRILSGSGYRVLTAPSGEWALSVANRHQDPIDLLLTDIMMPGMSGPQLARRFAALRPDTRILYMTGYQRDTSGGECSVPAESDLIEKPFRPEALLRRVRRALDGPRPAGFDVRRTILT